MMTTSLPNEFSIGDEFPAVGYDEWRAVVEESLQGAPFEKKLVTRTYDGLEIQPVYSPRDAVEGDDPLGFPGFAPFIRGSSPLGSAAGGWDVRQEFAHPHMETAHREIHDDLEGGATSLLLRLDAAARAGLDPDQEAAQELVGRDGMTVYSADDLNQLLADVDLLNVPVALDSGAAFLPAAALLIATWQRRGISPSDCRGAFNADPLGTLARRGRLPISESDALGSMAELARWTADNCPQVTAIGVDTSPYHDAGATAAQDLAFGIATAVEYLRALTERGVPIDSAAGQFLFQMCVGTHHFLAIAKLRAARQLWSRVIEASGGSPESGGMRLHVRVGHRVLTRRDPYVNMLRNTVALFAAGLGGAEIVTSVPFDALLGLPDAFSRRQARNAALVLMEEAHLNRVIDPAGGSWFLDRFTQQLAEKGWEIFQEIERQGGMLAALKSGWVAGQIDSAFTPRAKDIARRKQGITGVSEFPDVNEQPVEHSPVDLAGIAEASRARTTRARQAVDLSRSSFDAEPVAAAIEAAEAGATIGQIASALRFHQVESASITPLPCRRFAEPFEALRDASDACQVAGGQRPQVFLANMGPLAHYTGRAAYAKNFFAAGGFEVLGDTGFADADAAAAAFKNSGAGIAVICSSDKLYPETVPELAAKLKQAGARSVVLVGNSGDHESNWREAGVDRFIFISCDVLATLQEMLREENVLKTPC